jgi:hypothetical protein
MIDAIRSEETANIVRLEFTVLDGGRYWRRVEVKQGDWRPCEADVPEAWCLNEREIGSWEVRVS